MNDHQLCIVYYHHMKISVLRQLIKCRMSTFVVLPLCIYLHWRRARYQKERARTHAAQFMLSKLPSTYIMNNINYRDQLTWKLNAILLVLSLFSRMKKREMAIMILYCVFLALPFCCVAEWAERNTRDEMDSASSGSNCPKIHSFFYSVGSNGKMIAAHRARHWKVTST